MYQLLGIIYQENVTPSYSGLTTVQWLTTVIYHLCEFEFIFFGLLIVGIMQFCLIKIK